MGMERNRLERYLKGIIIGIIPINYIVDFGVSLIRGMGSAGYDWFSLELELERYMISECLCTNKIFEYIVPTMRRYPG